MGTDAHPPSPLSQRLKRASRETHSLSNALVSARLVALFTDRALYGRALGCFYLVHAELERCLDDAAKDPSKCSGCRLPGAGKGGPLPPPLSELRLAAPGAAAAPAAAPAAAAPAAVLAAVPAAAPAAPPAPARKHFSVVMDAELRQLVERKSYRREVRQGGRVINRAHGFAGDIGLRHRLTSPSPPLLPPPSPPQMLGEATLDWGLIAYRMGWEVAVCQERYRELRAQLSAAAAAPAQQPEREVARLIGPMGLARSALRHSPLPPPLHQRSGSPGIDTDGDASRRAQQGGREQDRLRQEQAPVDLRHQQRATAAPRAEAGRPRPCRCRGGGAGTRPAPALPLRRL